jgi:L-2-hydroxyglutarate oxidase
MTDKIFDAVIIGGGIVGAATALALQQNNIMQVAVIEAENEVAKHQTGNNSGVIHSGVYYKPGSLKAKLCTEGRELMYSFCEKNNINHQRCGKLIVAADENELPALNEIENRGNTNGLKGIKRLNRNQIKEYEPYAAGIQGLFIPQTGIVDFIGVTKKLAEIIKNDGGKVYTSCKFINVRSYSGYLVVETNKGEFKTKLLINCAGLFSDRVAKTCGFNPGVKIIPFRGEYYKIKKEKEYLVKNLIYPVPDPKFPFLGVHFTRMINGRIEAGPNALLAFSRIGYSYKDFSFKDLTEMFSFGGFWKRGAKHYKMGLNEFKRSLNKNLFVNALQKLVPELDYDDIIPGGAGVRAQALDKKGKLLDDFYIVENERQVHVLNSPSPAATASISIGKYIADIVIKKLRV